MPGKRDLNPEMSPLHFFGAEVRRAREAAAMTLADLGAMVPCDASTVSRIESGQLSPAERFADVNLSQASTLRSPKSPTTPRRERADQLGVRQLELDHNAEGQVYCLLEGPDEASIRRHHAALGVLCGDVHQVDSLT
jgi:Helix-turn-helix domain/Protein of unknown function (DUF4242)